MPVLHLILIAAIQGLTEFLPVSSSGHLVLLSLANEHSDQGLVLDVAVHIGTLFAVMWYFRADLREALMGTGRLMRGRLDTQGALLALCLIIATIPAVIFGLVMMLSGLDDLVRSVQVIGWATLIFGLLLYVADRRGAQNLNARQWGIKHAIWMGLAQSLALIPGTSRSGVCISAARALGYERTSAARIAMLMSIPVIIASGVAQSAGVISSSRWDLLRDGAIAASFAFCFAWIALAVMMRLLRTVSFTPYVIYRIALGCVLLSWAYWP